MKAYSAKLNGNPRTLGYWAPIRIITLSVHCSILICLLTAMLVVSLNLNNTAFLALLLPLIGPVNTLAFIAVMADLFLPDRYCWWKDPVTGYVDRWGS
jgi:hypothetical protein